MFFDYNNTTYCVNCDWLQYSVITTENDPSICCPSDCRVDCFTGNNVFRDRAIVSDAYGEPLFTALWHPHSRIIRSDLMTIQHHNRILYNSGIMLTHGLVQQFAPCNFNSVGRIDVCLDFEVTPYHWRVIRGLFDGSLYVSGKSQGSVWWHEGSYMGVKVRQPHCLSWGSPNSEIKVKLYNKSLEQGVDEESQRKAREAGRECLPLKPWIVNEWRRAGMDVSRVWRLEFSLHSSGQLAWNGRPIVLSEVVSSDWLWGVFCDCYRRRFVVRRNEGRRSAHKNEDSIVEFLRLPSSDIKIHWAECQHEDMEGMEGITLLRRLLKDLENPAVRADDALFNSLAGSIYHLLERPGMRSFFVHYFGDDPDVYLQRLFDDGGRGIHDSIPSPSMSWT